MLLKDKRRLILFAATLFLGTLGGLAPSLLSRSGPASGTGGAGGTPYNPDPHQVTPGRNESAIWGPKASPGAAARGRAADEADHSKPPFEGWVNGIYFYPDPSNAPPGFAPDKAGAAAPTCPGAERIVSEDELKSSGYYIDVPPALPQGAVEHEHIFGVACGTKIVVVDRQFELQPSGSLIGLVLRPGTRGAQYPTVADRVLPITINGLSGVLIPPLTDEGYGSSAIFILTGKGLLQIGGFDLRLSDLKAIAGSTR